MYIAVEGCGHGELDGIYAGIQHIEKVRSIKVDLLIICGDFQAVRNPDDLQCMAVPPKYYTMGTFYKYYSGELKAPVLTLVVGGNHEASNYMQSLAHGGWLAPNIYFVGYASVLRFGSLRIGALSGIYNGHDYLKGHHERPPYDKSSMRSAYHVRNVDTFRLKQLTPGLDIFISHDWPRGVYHHGDVEQLLRKKPFFREEVESNKLGSRPAEELLGRLQPRFWFAAHLHVKFSALVRHPPDAAAEDGTTEKSGEEQAGDDGPEPASENGEKVVEKDGAQTAKEKEEQKVEEEGRQKAGEGGEKPAEEKGAKTAKEEGAQAAEKEETQSAGKGETSDPQEKADDSSTAGRVTRFLALDKCLPRRRYMQVLEVGEGEPELRYDLEWLTVLRLTDHLTSVSPSAQYMPGPGCGQRYEFRPTAEELAATAAVWGDELRVPPEFTVTAPPYDGKSDIRAGRQPPAEVHPHTAWFCAKLGVQDPMALLCGAGGGPGAAPRPMPPDPAQADITLDCDVTLDPDGDPAEIPLSDEDEDEDEDAMFVIDRRGTSTPHARARSGGFSLPTPTRSSLSLPPPLRSGGLSLPPPTQPEGAGRSPDSPKQPAEAEPLEDSKSSPQTPKANTEAGKGAGSAVKRFKRRNQAIYGAEEEA